jgi:hypothetical protein
MEGRGCGYDRPTTTAREMAERSTAWALVLMKKNESEKKRSQ